MKPLINYITEQVQNPSPYLVDHEGEIEKKVFIIIKPGFLDKATSIMDKFKRAGFIPKLWRTKQLTMGEAKRLYYTHKDEDFYYNLCKYMSSGPCMGIELSYWGEGKVFDLMADLKSKIRKQYGEDDMRNCLHSSDSLKAMQTESKVFF